MSTPRFVSLLGLGFGDCGKGMFTDALCRRWPVHAVVRFNGGAQAGHNVVLPDRRQHTFSQFSSGSFVPGVSTVLAYPVLVHPVLIGLAPKDVFIVNILDEKRVASPLCEPKAAHTVARRRNNGSLWVARSAWELTR